MKDLTRTYRPKDWNSIIGQDTLVKTLKNEIETNSVGHAYLFTGPRGTGKTTTGRVFASYLDAQVIELDGASNNGVENIRNLRDDVLYLPIDGKKYKVYIIDEVHMLTTGAFNAFLKTLEEPPAHVIFVLATTDPQKIPNTILSRCQRFDLKRIGIKDISNRLQYICEEEKIKLDRDDPLGVLDYISNQVDGGMRDAIKLLQKCTSLDEVITIQTVVDALGSVNEIHLREMSFLLENKKIKEVIEKFNSLVAEGIDIKIYLADLVEFLKEEISTSISNNDFKISLKMKIVEELLALLSGLKNATQVKTIVEISLIKLCLIEVSEKEEIKNAAPTQQVINQIINQIDDDVIKQILDRMTNLEKRIVVQEMTTDQLKLRR